LLIVIIYHIWVLSGSVSINNSVSAIFIMLGGEIGVTAFFVLSGFGIYYACSNMIQKENLKFSLFMKKRLVRILPEYYISIAFVLFITSEGAAYISKGGVKPVITHLVFLHNFFPYFAGTINGVLWTMGVTVQFYLLAIVFFKLLCKFKGFFAIMAIIFTVAIKFILFHYVGTYYEGLNYFWLSRELPISVLDNFIIGMYVAQLIQRKDSIEKKNAWNITGVAISLIALYFIAQFGWRHGIHTDNVSGYLWHSLIAICLGVCLYFCAKLKYEYSNPISKFLLWISSHEYGIYLIHLVVIRCMLTNSELIKNLLSGHMIIAWIVLLICSVGLGILFSAIVNSFRKVYIKA
jgi:peptidoglycan/LPS O-acetylase OafA/YrhL